MYDLDGAPGADNIAGQPDFTIAANTDPTHKFMIGNARNVVPGL
jgi:hypothetical protein